MKISVFSYNNLSNHQFPDGFARVEGVTIKAKYGRLSSKWDLTKRRITLVTASTGAETPLFAARSPKESLEDARQDLGNRLGTRNIKNISYIKLDQSKEGYSGQWKSLSAETVSKIVVWMSQKGIDTVILPEFDQNLNDQQARDLLRNDVEVTRRTLEHYLKLPNSIQQVQGNHLSAIYPKGRDCSADIYSTSLVRDFSERDSWEQASVPKNEWFQDRFGKWGPRAKAFPAPAIPDGVSLVRWKRDRIVAVAKRYCGLPYMNWSNGLRGHFPARGCGLDCSNFVAWVYNYGLGIQFSSSIEELAKGVNSASAGRFLEPGEPLERGDLIIFNGNPKHVVIYIDEGHVIDSTSYREGGVQIREVSRVGSFWWFSNLRFKQPISIRRPIE